MPNAKTLMPEETKEIEAANNWYAFEPQIY
jgi:hypothetical protein